MDSDDWKEFKKKGKEIRKGRMERHTRTIHNFALDNNLKYIVINPWQIRIADNRTTLDIYPQSKRYHNLTKGKRGDYYNLKGFLKSIFGNEARKSSGKGLNGDVGS